MLNVQFQQSSRISKVQSTGRAAQIKKCSQIQNFIQFSEGESKLTVSVVRFQLSISVFPKIGVFAQKNTAISIAVLLVKLQSPAEMDLSGQKFPSKGVQSESLIKKVKGNGIYKFRFSHKGESLLWFLGYYLAAFSCKYTCTFVEL